MYETKQYFYGTGRRKHSVARVRVYNGTKNKNGVFDQSEKPLAGIKVSDGLNVVETAADGSFNKYIEKKKSDEN